MNKTTQPIRKQSEIDKLSSYFWNKNLCNVYIWNFHGTQDS